MKVRTILGVDPSTKTGWAVVDRERIREVGTLYAPKQENRIRQYAELADRLVDTVSVYCPAFAVVEGYSYAGRFVNAGQFEIGALVRDRLLAAGIPVCDVAPRSVKKFATGNGKATKKQMVAAARDLWGYDGKDDNQADALAMAYLGLVLEGAVNVPMAVEFKDLEKIGRVLI